MSAPTRECLGCKGTGCKYPLCAGKAVNWCHSVECIACPVCLGSGRVEAKPGVRDAVADAETLYRIVYRSSGNPKATVLARVGRSGQYASTMMACNEDFPGTSADKCAVQAARAAFRAVPGLRG